MRYFDELTSATHDAREAFLAIAAVRRGIQGRIGRRSYLAFLGQAYYHVSHTVPLLMACGARVAPRQEWLRQALAVYIAEEMGHQEWILDDIRSTGGDPDQARLAAPLPATELMVAYAYDGIQRGNPLSLFGMVFVLEGSSVALATRAAAAIQRALGLPDGALTYLRSHGVLDQQHMQRFEALMNRLEDAGDRLAVTHAARMFYRLYGDIFRSLPLDEDQERSAA